MIDTIPPSKFYVHHQSSKLPLNLDKATGYIKDCKMYPTKSMLDYMTEMNRLFPKNNENDVFQTTVNIPTPSPFSLSTPVNRSSSSTDSTSPESFPDMHALSDSGRGSNTAYKTPFVNRRQRPIVGRRIMTETPNFEQPITTAKRFEQDNEYSSTFWQPDDSLLLSHTPPNVGMYIEQKNTQNDFYELFPAENKGFEFKTPVKNPTSNISPASMFSPTASVSPTLSNISANMAHMSPNSLKLGPVVPYSSTMSPVEYSSPIFGPSSSRYDDMRPKICTFCRKNGETPIVYMTHTVKQKIGNRDVVTCPILRSHVCSTCGASGDDAHTITYCPVLRRNNNGQPLQSTTITLKNTRVKSNGRRRY